MCALKFSNRTLSDQLIIAMLEYNTSTMENIENVVGKNYWIFQKVIVQIIN